MVTKVKTQELINFVPDPQTLRALDELNELAKLRHREDDVKLGPGQYPFKSQIIRRAIEIAEPAIRSGLEEEGITFLFS